MQSGEVSVLKQQTEFLDHYHILGYINSLNIIQFRLKMGKKVISVPGKPIFRDCVL